MFSILFKYSSLSSRDQTLQKLEVQSIRNSDTFQIPYMWNILKTAETDSRKYQKFHLKLQRLVVQSIRISNTFEILYISNILKPTTQQISYLNLQRLHGSPKYQNCIRNSDTFETLYISNILKTAETGSPKYQKFWYFWNPLYVKYT